MTQAAADRARVAGAAVVLALALFLVLRGGGEDGPPDTLAELVPAGRARLRAPVARTRTARRTRASPGSPAASRRSRGCATRSPARSPPARSRSSATCGRGSGDEAAYAAVSPADTLLLAAVADRPRAEALVARIGNLDTAATHRGVRVLSAGPTSLAFVRDDVLAVGTAAAVRAAIDRAQGEGDALAGRDRLRAGDRGPARRPHARRLRVRPGRPRGARRARRAARRRRRAARPPGARGRRRRARRRGGPACGSAARLAGGGPEDASFTPVLVERVPEAAVAYLGVQDASRGWCACSAASAPGRPSTRCARCSPTTPASTSTASSSRRSRARSRSP